MNIHTLKMLSWESNWENYIQYGQPKKSIVEHSFFENSLLPELIEPSTYALLSVMKQLENKMSVYEAFLKAVEVVAGLESNNTNSTTKKLLIKYKKMEIKNIQKGIFDEELAAYISALYAGYRRYCVSRTQHFGESGSGMPYNVILSAENNSIN